jgi:hypothetical protein
VEGVREVTVVDYEGIASPEDLPAIWSTAVMKEFFKTSKVTGSSVVVLDMIRRPDE